MLSALLRIFPFTFDNEALEEKSIHSEAYVQKEIQREIFSHGRYFSLVTHLGWRFCQHRPRCLNKNLSQSFPRRCTVFFCPRAIVSLSVALANVTRPFICLSSDVFFGQPSHKFEAQLSSSFCCVSSNGHSRRTHQIWSEADINKG